MPEKSRTAGPSKGVFWPLIFLTLVFLLIPFEHKYDKLFRHCSLITGTTGNIDLKIIFYFSDLVAITLFIWGWLRIRERFFDRGAIYLGALFGFLLISIVTSPLSSNPILYIRLIEFSTPLLLFIFLSKAPFDLKRIFPIWSWCLFGVGLIQSVIAILQYFFQRSIGLKFFGEQPLCAIINVPHGHRWIFDQIFHQEASNTLFRAMGTLPHPNWLGGFLMTSLLIGMYFFLKYPRYRLWLGFSYVFLLFGLAITFSRSALFGYILGTIVFLLWLRYREKMKIRLLASLAIFSCVFVSGLLHEQILYRGGIFNSTGLSRASNEIRIRFHHAAFEMIQKHPLTGVGFNQFSNSVSKELTNVCKPMPSVVHNIYLLLATEAGLLALAVFLLWIGYILKLGWSAIPSPEIGLLFSAFIGFLFIGGCDHYPLLFQQGKLIFFGIAGLLARFSRNPEYQLCLI